MIGTIPWDVNYIAVVAAAALGMAIGAVYFSPWALGTAWMNANRRTPEEIAAGNNSMLYAVAAVVTLAMAAVLSAAIGWSGAVGVGGGTMVGFLLWLGMVMPSLTLAYGFGGKSVPAIAIQLGHPLVLLVAMGGLIGGWPV